MLLRILRTHLAPYKPWLAAIVALQFTATVAMLYLPSLNADIIDKGVVTGDTGYIVRHGGLMLVVSLVQVSAGTGSPEPPLVLEPGWPLALAVLAVLIAAVIAAVELTTRRALRDDMPLRPAWSAE